ncbi:hypothetical protein FA15DRAFT_585064 [Coprinopsis marcescibilis]|uniref:SP-RING-type domain-containing protein n=1 Tax=Coprinopsis marcescibilis TaxID=230819 RepID=A0A5C3L5M8_COPMA|nr:hypothetical protein FA15DRAFT_585064 [Coprinopsis marcescibilis]
MVQGIAAAIAESTDEADADQPIARLDEIMRELIDLGAEMQANASVIDNLKQMVARGERIDNVVDRYQDEARAKKEAYHGKSTRQKYAKHDAYMEFKSGIWQMQHPDAAMPPLTNFIPKEDGDKSDDDDDLEIGGQIQDFKCPITLTPLVDPLTSMLCGHSYDANALRSMLRGDIKDCPASGCRKKISIADCKADPELAKKAKSYARRIARQEEDEHSEAEEVIE